MIKEEYVSFEVAKLLKEKAFNEYCWKLYEFGDCDMPVLLNGFELDSESGFWNNEYLELYKKEHSYINDICSAPTLQMAMRWLRERKIYIMIDRSWSMADSWQYCICVNNDFDNLIQQTSVPNRTYEEAVEAALKYSLENLI